MSHAIFVSDVPFLSFPCIKDMAQIGIKLFSNDLDLAQPTLGQLYDTSSGHQQSLYEIATSNVFP